LIPEPSVFIDDRLPIVDSVVRLAPPQVLEGLFDQREEEEDGEGGHRPKPARRREVGDLLEDGDQQKVEIGQLRKL
jgi:hypothetical protein